MADYLKFEEIGYSELEAMNPDKTIFVLSISLMEEHGPHMPFGVDVFVLFGSDDASL